MIRPLPDLGPKVKVFSNTMGGGVRGASRRLKDWSRRDPGQLFQNAYRKIRKALTPRSLPFAQAIHIEVTNACNLQCVMCPHPDMERPTGRMDRALFERIVGQLAHYRHLLEGVALMGLGEPLLHNELEIFSRLAKQAGLPNVYTSTNAMLLDESRAQTMLTEGRFDRIIFSLDGASAETFLKLRKGADFDRVCQNVEGFLLRKQGRVKAPGATLQILVVSETVDEIEAFCRRWLPLLGDNDDILVKEVDTFGGQVQDRRLDTDREPKNRFACRQLWKDLSISWDGQVTVCCKDVFYKLSVGNVADEPLDRLWKGDKWEALRRAHQAGKFSMNPCNACREWYV